MTELTPRNQQVLYAVVQDYIATAEPVGSKQVSEKRNILLSPATIRHIMSELEDLGLLKRAHASSGRIPTSQAYRVYVDQLMKVKPLSSREKEAIKKRVEDGLSNPMDALRESSRLISERSHQMGIAITPRSEDERLAHIQLIRLKGAMALVVLVSSIGIVQNKFISLDPALQQKDLDQMHNYLNQILRGKTMKEIRKQILNEMKQDQIRYNSLLNQALILGDQVFNVKDRNLHLAGQQNLLMDPAFSDTDKMKAILRTLEERTHIIEILDQCLIHPGVKIFVGEDIEAPEIDGLTFITSVYSDAEGNRGVLGVVGPTRMNYARIVPLVDYTAAMVTEVLGDQS